MINELAKGHVDMWYFFCITLIFVNDFKYFVGNVLSSWHISLFKKWMTIWCVKATWIKISSPCERNTMPCYYLFHHHQQYISCSANSRLSANFIEGYRISHRRCAVKKVLKISKFSREKTCVGVSFIKKRLQHKYFTPTFNLNGICERLLFRAQFSVH